MEPNAGWPTWAIIVLIVSVVLSVVAFFIGNFINKRNSPRYDIGTYRIVLS